MSADELWRMRAWLRRWRWPPRAAAQGQSDSEAFLEAIEEQRNARRSSWSPRAGRGHQLSRLSAATPLTAAMRKRATACMSISCSEGADPNVADSKAIRR